MGINALLTYNYGKEKTENLAKLGYDITLIDESKITWDDKFESTEVLACYNPFNRIDISKMKKLKLIQLSSVGIDQISQKDRINPKFMLCNNKGGYSIPMGEFAVLKILELYKNSKNQYEKQRNKLWKWDVNVLELFGKTVGFIGTGSIASESAKRLQGFEVNIIGMNTNGKETQYFDKCFPAILLNEMLPLCDVVVITIPYTKATHHFIDAQCFNAMKDGVYFINIARGAIVDELALIDCLKSGKLKGAALDVFEVEPLPIDNPLWDLKNVIITPHNSWISQMKDTRRYNILYQNMKNYANGVSLNNIVNIEKGY